VTASVRSFRLIIGVFDDLFMIFRQLILFRLLFASLLWLQTSSDQRGKGLANFSF
jgi:hypothetical protein